MAANRERIIIPDTETTSILHKDRVVTLTAIHFDGDDRHARVKHRLSYRYFGRLLRDPSGNFCASSFQGSNTIAPDGRVSFTLRVTR